VLEPQADGFRNYFRGGSGYETSAEQALVERAGLLTLTAPEMTVLVGGLRVLKANAAGSEFGVFTTRPETLTNDFFVNLLDMRNEWQPVSESAFAFSNPGRLEDTFAARDRASGEIRWKGTRVDLVFGSNSELRALAEVYACEDALPAFVQDFVAAWHKVMNLDRFDLA